MARGRDDQRVGKPERRVTGSKRGRRLRDSGAEWLDADRNALDKTPNDGDLSALPRRPDQYLGKRGRGQHETVIAASCVAQRRVRGGMMCIVGVEEADQDPGVEDGQSHSSRNRVSSFGS